MADATTPFGEWLKARREDRGMTLRDVERATNGRVSNAALSQIETGKIESPGVITLHQIAAAMALDFAEVCERACVGSRPPAAPDVCPHCGQVVRSERKDQ